MTKSIIVAAVLAAAGSASAQLFEQEIDPAFAGALSDAPGGFFDVRQADNFTLAEQSFVDGFSWAGFQEAFDGLNFPVGSFPGNIAGFSVELFEAAGGLPGSSIFQQDILLGDLDVLTIAPGVPGMSSEVAQFTASISTLTLDAGEYFFAVNLIANAPTLDDPSWVWASSLQGDGLSATETGVFSGNFAASTGDFAFAVLGEPVPAPGAAALLGLGGLAAIRRRR